MNMKQKIKIIEKKLLKFFKDEDRIHKDKRDQKQSQEPKADKG